MVGRRDLFSRSGGGACISMRSEGRGPRGRKPGIRVGGSAAKYGPFAAREA